MCRHITRAEILNAAGVDFATRSLYGIMIELIWPGKQEVSYERKE